MRKPLCIPVMFFLLVQLSCKKAGPEILPIDRMKVIMLDLMRADELYVRLAVKDSTAAKRKENIRLYTEVFLLHKVRKGQFDSSFKYYEAHPLEMKVLVDSLDNFANRERERKVHKYGQAE